MRLFTAVEFDANLRKYIGEIQNELKKFCVKGHFTREDNFHLTLIFIGERSVSDLPAIMSAIDLGVKDLKQFNMAIGEPGCFAKTSRKILWLGLDGETESLSKLYTQLENALLSHGVITQRQKYSPHITIGREVILSEQISKIKEQIPSGKISFPVSKVSLMESIRENDRLVYRPLYQKNLRVD